MKHLTEDELCALLDGEAKPAARSSAESHLESCDVCRAVLAGLTAQHEQLSRALDHDPGDAYFAGFASNVQERLRAERSISSLRADSVGGWFSRPRNLVIAGSLGALVVAVGVVFVASQSPNVEFFKLHSPAATAQRAPAEESAPDLESTEGNTERDAVGSKPATGEPQMDSQKENLARGATPARAQRVTRNAAGEDVPATPERGFAQSPAPAPAPAAAPGASSEPTTVAKLRGERAATPMQSAPEAHKNETPKTSTQLMEDKLRASSEHAKALAKSQLPATTQGEVRSLEEVSRDQARKDEAPSTSSFGSTSDDASRVFVCGEVRDAGGRPLADATVTLLSGAAMARTDAKGSYCFKAPAGMDSLIVTRLGFRSARATVRLAEGQMLATIKLEPVAALGAVTPAAPRPADGTPAATLDVFPDSLRLEAVRASGALSHAQRTGEAGGFDIAASLWSRLATRAKGTDAELVARERLAEARYRAWEAEPTAHRAGLALEALTAFAIRAPQGAQRDLATQRLDRVRLGK